MATFKYQARTREGEARSGVVEAPTMEGAVDALQRNNLIILSVEPAAAEGRLFIEGRLRIFERVSQKDIVLLSRELATLFEAKVPVLQALKTLMSESSSTPLREAMASVLDDVNGGAALSLALSRHPSIFSQFYINMVRSGEESGKLQDVFTYLADYLERSYTLTTKARNAMIYPAFVLVAFVGVVVVMLIVVIPKLTTIFAETGQAVPFYTQAIISASNFLRSWGWTLLFLLAAFAVFLWRFAKTSRGRFVLDELQLKIPIVGNLYQKIYLARFSDNLSTLISAGLPILRALQISASIVGNKVYEEAILAASESVKAGNTIASAFEGYPYIPPLVIQMIRIGEEAGRLDSILRSIARFYQRDVDGLLENLVALIEPALIIGLGVAVGVLIAAVLVPLYNLSSAI